jgi:hypothetical protein
VKYSFEDTFQVRIDLVVPNTNDRETVGLEFRVARFVSDRLAPPRVLTAVELDNHSWVIAGKIDDEAPDRSLPPKAESEPPEFTQMQPESEFLAGHALAHLARQFIGHAVDYTIPPPGALRAQAAERKRKE